MADWKMKRFWKTVSIIQAGDGFAITLDDRSIRTPAKSALVVPTYALAKAIAAEWELQKEVVRPDQMPLTRAANSALDKIAHQRVAVVEILAEYGATDLICYRADGPETLSARQALLWNPLLDWAAERFTARLTPITGVMFAEQPPSALLSLQAAVEEHSVFELAGLHDLVTLSGSLILGLAVSDGFMSAAKAWPLSRVDEQWQEEQWGSDTEALDTAARKEADFLQAEKLLNLLKET